MLPLVKEVKVVTETLVVSLRKSDGNDDSGCGSLGSTCGDGAGGNEVVVMDLLTMVVVEDVALAIPEEYA